MAELPHSHQIAMKIGANIRSLRKAKQCTQYALAMQIDVEPETVSRLERGVTLPSLHMLQRLAEVFGISIGKLVDGATEQRAETVLMMEHLSSLSASHRHVVVEVAEHLCELLAQQETRDQTPE